MLNIIVAFSRPEDGKNIKNILTKNGLRVTALCTSASQVLAHAGDLRSGLVICGFQFGDMTCRQMSEHLLPGFDVLLIASPSRWSGENMGEIVCLPAPFKVCDLISTVRMVEKLQMEHRKQRRRAPIQQRSEEESQAIEKAKELLISSRRMTEPEAHRYLQKCSMDSGTGIVEAARMVLTLYQSEAG